jgi:hypothetical protein
VVTGTHVAVGVSLDDVQDVMQDEAMHGGDHNKVILDLDWSVGATAREPLMWLRRPWRPRMAWRWTFH